MNSLINESQLMHQRRSMDNWEVKKPNLPMKRRKFYMKQGNLLTRKLRKEEGQQQQLPKLRMSIQVASNFVFPEVREMLKCRELAKKFKQPYKMSSNWSSTFKYTDKALALDNYYSQVINLSIIKRLLKVFGEFPKISQTTSNVNLREMMTKNIGGLFIIMNCLNYDKDLDAIILRMADDGERIIKIRIPLEKWWTTQAVDWSDNAQDCQLTLAELDEAKRLTQDFYTHATRVFKEWREAAVVLMAGAYFFQSIKVNVNNSVVFYEQTLKNLLQLLSGNKEAYELDFAIISNHLRNTIKKLQLFYDKIISHVKIDLSMPLIFEDD